MSQTLGVLGGGQLGLMFVQAAGKLGFDVRILSEEAGSPAGRIAAGEMVGSLSDEAAIRSFAQTVDALTWEVENVSWEAVTAAARDVRVRPFPAVLRTVQDRIEQKRFLAEAGLPTAPYRAVVAENDLEDAEYSAEQPSFLKRARSGYDGRGQARVGSPGEALRAWKEMGRRPCILEPAVEFEREFSVIVARADSGQVVSFPPIENIHVEGILD
ncbi:MAG: ATP-grasp domain-containing protein, partial [Dehalococcoidia bacterium]